MGSLKEDSNMLAEGEQEFEEEFTDALDSIEDWILARRGIQLVLNNKYAEAQSLFINKTGSVQLAASHCFVVFMNALMTFEDDLLAESMAALRDMEKRCAQDIGWLKSVRNKVFGTILPNEKNMAQRLEEQIILADSQVCIALLTFLQQDVSGYMRGGWVLRKAWKVYQHTYHQILELYRRTYGYEQKVPGSDFPSWRVVTRSSASQYAVDSPCSDWSIPNSAAQSTSSITPSPNSSLLSPSTASNGISSSTYRNPFSSLFSSFTSSPQSEVPAEVVSRLMCAVSFGYGVFQLCISLLPPSLLKLIQFLGFGGDRVGGLEALMFSRQGHDMRAPLATLALLWYHTIVRPFFALDGCNIQAGVEVASNLIEESQPEFGESALFLFFKGRVHRLKCNIPLALQAYVSAVEKSPQREVQILCLHEVSWCHLIQLDWGKAHGAFLQLKRCSRWSKTFYTYLAAVCAGANNKMKEALKLSQEISVISTTNGHCQRSSGIQQLENFICRRAAKMSGQDASYCRLLAYEMLFLWNALPSSQQNAVITSDCESNQGEEPMVGLRSLILGAVHSCVGHTREAVANFRAAITARADIPDTADDSHVTAFALYELAVILIKECQCLDEAQALLERAQRDFKGYDFENRLNVRIHAALRNLYN